jgi:hypothetical protein
MGDGEMTNEEINQTIAEITGVYQPDHIGGLYHTANGWLRYCPDYCADLNAMHQAEKHLELEAWPEYISLLIRHSDEAVHASARQRAEAFLRFYGKW